MSIIGNALSVGGGSSTEGAMLRVETNISDTATVTLTKGNFTESAYPKHSETASGNCNYHFQIPPSEFSSGILDSFTVSGDSTYYEGSSSISIVAPGEYGMDLKMNRKEFVIWDGSLYNLSPSSSPAGGFVALKGTVSSQNDTIAYPSNPACVDYTENNNDYGGIRTSNSISFNGYATLYVKIDLVNSWQDPGGGSPAEPSYCATVVFTDEAKTQTSSNGYINYSVGDSEVIDQNGYAHLSNAGPYTISFNVSNYNSSYYIYVTCASGEKSGAGKGRLKISRIWLEK